MQHVRFSELDAFGIAILMKESALHRERMQRHYVSVLDRAGIPEGTAIGFSLKYEANGKSTATTRRAYLDTLLKALDSLSIHTLYVADGEYFKTLTGQTKAEVHLGYVLPCKIKDYEHMHVIYGINYQQLVYDDRKQEALDRSLQTLVDHWQGNYAEIGKDIIHHAEYPDTLAEIQGFLSRLHQYPELTADFETASLQFWRAGIGTVSLCWDQHSGGAFCVDYQEVLGNREITFNPEVRALLREFFETYQGKLTWHNANYDCKVAIFQLWMEHELDWEGMLYGLEILTRNFDDTKLIAFLATNSCAGNQLGLKHLAHEFAGNYAQEDIDDILLIPKDKLLEYNLVDGLSTWFVKNKYWPLMVADQQLDIYETILKPSVKLLLQMELVGLPLDMTAVLEAEIQLRKDRNAAANTLRTLSIVTEYETHLRQQKWQKDWDDRLKKSKTGKIKTKDISAFDDIVFNPGSGDQVRALLYGHLKYPVLDKTKSGAAATGHKTLKKLAKLIEDPEHQLFLQTLKEYSEASKMLNTFIKAFKENSFLKRDGWWYLHGNFNIGGTVSGRLSSSKPNLQNLPSGGDNKYTKLLKACFKAPPGALFAGIDFNALEDRVNALLTKDPNKIKVLTDGFDGHCFRTVSYWPKEFQHIDRNDPEQVNSIKDHPKRGKSKAPSFALQYLGTWMTLVKNCGFSPEEAKEIEANFHKLYEVSRQWVEGKIAQAAKDGYTTLAFGLRLRTPMLKKCIWGSNSVPREAQAEARTMGNAVSGQSYGLLNNRAGIELQEKTLASPYRTLVLPCAHIHDAQYFLILEDIQVLHWLNIEAPKAMAWQELEELKHPQVGLSGELDIYWPNWSKALTIPNNATEQEIAELCAQHEQKLETA